MKAPRLCDALFRQLPVLMALTLALPVLALRPSTASAGSARTAPQAVAAAEDKKRVPKPQPAPPRTEPDKPAETSSASEDGSGGFFETCLSDCIGSCIESGFEALWASMFVRKSTAPALADSASAPGALAMDAAGVADTTLAESGYEPHPWARYDVGYLRAYVPGDSIVLRRGPSDPDSVQLESGRLPDGARVLVNATHAGPGGMMLDVSAVDSQRRSGWVHEKSVRRTPSWSAAPSDTLASEAAPADTLAPKASLSDTLAPKPAPADTLARTSALANPLPASAARQRWAIVFSAGPAVIDNPELSDEYSNGAATLELEYLRCMKSAWVLGAGAGYRGFSGKPQAEYVGATEIDSPRDSRFRLTYAMAEFGQRHAWVRGLRLGYMAGPVVGYVYEDATILVLDASTRVPIGGRHDQLARWAGGGGMIAWIGVAPPIPLELGFRFRIFGLAWAGRHQKSLTSDWTDEGLLHIDAAITLTHAGY